jgi:hypothetical protein
MFSTFHHRKHVSAAQMVCVGVAVVAADAVRNVVERENKRRFNRWIGGVWAA